MTSPKSKKELFTVRFLTENIKSVDESRQVDESGFVTPETRLPVNLFTRLLFTVRVSVLQGSSLR